MGAFYDSVQIRSDDHEAVRTLLEELARKKKRRFLLGPVLNGWIGVYPNQDVAAARDLARRLRVELLALNVHDDDIFLYEYYRDGKRADRYNSAPDYFEEVSDKERRMLRGRPELLAHLVSDPARFQTLLGRLTAQEHDSVVFASELLETFADALGIRNALTSYTYLKEHEETDDVEGWDRFLHIPDLSSEHTRKLLQDAALQKQKQQLIQEGRLLAEHGGRPGITSPRPWSCRSPDGEGFLVAWSSHIDPQEAQLPLERYGPPWSVGPATTRWAISPHVYGLELSPSGRYLAVAHAAGDWHATLWNLAENRLVADVPQVRAVSSIGFLPDESAMYSASSDGDEGRVVLTPVDGREARSFPIELADRAAIHPSGAWLVVTDNYNRLFVIDLPSGKVRLAGFVGGRAPFNPLQQQLAAQVSAAANQVDFNALAERMRKQLEAQLDSLGPTELPPGVESVEQFRESLRQQCEEQLLRMREQFARVGSAQPESGTEKVFCLRFDPTGEYLCLGTMAGVRVLNFRDVRDADGALPTPAFAVAAVGLEVAVSKGAIYRGSSYVYDLEIDGERNRLLFAGVDGRVGYLDLDSGNSGTLLEVPDRPAIQRLALSGDLTTLALTCLPDMMSRSRNKRGPVLQFWSYRTISSA
jgi:WD40 repeat protein